MKNYLTDSREKLSSLRSLNDFYILSFESSCDETAVAVTKGREIVSNIISSQIEIHKRFGGVVPEIASRNHALQIDHLTREALDAAGIELKDVSAVAVTYGAGLLGALLVGVSYAKALAYAANLPLIAVNHIKGHVAANFISAPELEPPFIALLASGGHTYILSVKSMSDMEILGATLDDAVGEAFDKAARVLGLPYPGGPEIERAAKGGKPVYKLPRALKGEKRLDFSFSGLKTSVINTIHNASQKGEPIHTADLAASYQKAVVGCLVDHLEKAAVNYKYQKIVLAGGVSANSLLRAECEKFCKKRGIRLFKPELNYCGDNGAMVAAQGYYEYQSGVKAGSDLNAYANMPIDSIKF